MEPKYSQKMIDAIEEGEKDIAEGRVYTEEEVLKMFAGKTDTKFIPDFDNLTPEEQEIEDSLESGEYVTDIGCPSSRIGASHHWCGYKAKK
ncbi:hypothetical protein IPH92_04805 [Candidatus Kaiserbacteria bacterium]|nr:MAG: hypothetical protein IPH92_04805 [Candidatus Kaiserbacteria bacterium]